jgi:hypothetical protein
MRPTEETSEACTNEKILKRPFRRLESTKSSGRAGTVQQDPRAPYALHMANLVPMKWWSLRKSSQSADTLAVNTTFANVQNEHGGILTDIVHAQCLGVDLRCY